MNRQQAKELLPIIQAFAEGKTIQIKALDGLWHDDNGDNIRFYAKPKNYRIKPLQKYRPFKNKKECWEEMLKHQPFGWVKDMYIDVFELVPNNDRPRNDCYNCLGCSHLFAVNVDSSHNIYIECDIDNEDIFKI